MEKFLLCSLVLLVGISAEAAAWLHDKGKSEFITSYENKTLTTYYTDSQTNQASIYRVYSFDLYNIFYQYGLTEDLNIGASTKWYNYKGFISGVTANNYAESNNSLLLRNAPSEDLVFLAETESYLNDYYRNTENKPLDTKVFIQKSLWTNDHSILSIQPSVQFYNYTWDKALELRLLYGYSFKLGPEYSYINIETALNRETYEFFVKNEDDTTFALDLTLGLGVTENNTLILQSFYKYNGDKQIKENIGEVSLAHKFNQYITWQNGYSTNLNDRNEYISESFITSILLKF